MLITSFANPNVSCSPSNQELTRPILVSLYPTWSGRFLKVNW